PQLGSLAQLMADARVLLLLDALNEMPHTSDREYRELVALWRRFVSETMAEHPGNRAVFTCRTLDYSAPLSSGTVRVPQLVLEPLNDEQVRAFLQLHCPHEAEDVWRTLMCTSAMELVRTPYFLELLAELAEAEARPRGGR